MNAVNKGMFAVIVVEVFEFNEDRSVVIEDITVGLIVSDVDVDPLKIVGTVPVYDMGAVVLEVIPVVILSIELVDLPVVGGEPPSMAEEVIKGVGPPVSKEVGVGPPVVKEVGVGVSVLSLAGVGVLVDTGNPV